MRSISHFTLYVKSSINFLIQNLIIDDSVQNVIWDCSKLIKIKEKQLDGNTHWVIFSKRAMGYNSWTKKYLKTYKSYCVASRGTEMKELIWWLRPQWLWVSIILMCGGGNVIYYIWKNPSTVTISFQFEVAVTFTEKIAVFVRNSNKNVLPKVDEKCKTFLTIFVKKKPIFPYS